MAAILLALGSSLTWGVGDFIGGMIARRWSIVMVLLGTSLGGVVFAAALAIGSHEVVPPTGDLLLGALAGVAALIALGAFYRALAIGKMSIVAPVSTTGVVIPVTVGIIGGDAVGLLTAIGFVCAVGGVMLASREQQAVPAVAAGVELPNTRVERAAGHRLSIVLAVLSGAGFGSIFVLIEKASHVSVFWPLLALKTASLVTILVVIAVVVLSGKRQSLRPAPQGLGWCFPVVVGCLDVTANAMYAHASTRGELSVIAVLASLFPVITVLLAHRVLGERIVLVQRVGVALALVGVLVLAGS